MRKYPLGPWPCARTIGRWLKAAGLTQKRKHRAPPGAVVAVTPPRALHSNDLWTVDFKGWFRTRDGQRVYALTVRDLATRYILLVRHVAQADERAVAAIFRRLFRRYGTPKAIQTDNGPPFGGVGPRGWSTLAVGWVRVGITMVYGRPRCPQDNAEHEQMHRVLQAETAQPPATSVAAQQRRFERWRQAYNCDRPHRALGMRPPCAFYRPNGRCSKVLRWTYPQTWATQRTDARGRIKWAGAKRVIGRAFARQLIALRPLREDAVTVYLGPHLLGELHARDKAGIRAVKVRHLPKTGGEAAASPASPLLNPGKGGGYAPSLKPSPFIKMAPVPDSEV